MNIKIINSVLCTTTLIGTAYLADKLSNDKKFRKKHQIDNYILLALPKKKLYKAKGLNRETDQVFVKAFNYVIDSINYLALIKIVCAKESDLTPVFFSSKLSVITYLYNKLLSQNYTLETLKVETIAKVGLVSLGIMSAIGLIDSFNQ